MSVLSWPVHTACMMTSTPSSWEAFPFEKTSRSYVWKYFQRDKCSVQCLLCNKAFVYNGAWDNLESDFLFTKEASIHCIASQRHRTFDDSFILGMFNSLGFRIIILPYFLLKISPKQKALSKILLCKSFECSWWENLLQILNKFWLSKSLIVKIVRSITG